MWVASRDLGHMGKLREKTLRETVRETVGESGRRGEVGGWGASGAGVATPELGVEGAQDLDVPWNVVVHNDPVNLMSYVTRVFQKVLGFAREQAERHMLEVHQKGRSVVWTGAREQAELYVQQLQSHLLLTTLERSV